MPHPEWALKFRTKGTELRHINGRFYLYQVSSRWNKEKKRSQKITGPCLGTVTPDGLVPTREARIRAELNSVLTPLRVKEYGATTALRSLMSESVKKLEELFPDWYPHLVVMIMSRLLYHAPLKSMPLHFAHSWLSEIFPHLSLTEKSVSACLRAVGAQREPIVSYLKTFIQNEDHLILDVTHMVTQSQSLSLAHCGYNSQQVHDPQVNLFFIFSATAHQPLFYRLLPGNIREIKACHLTLKESGIAKAILIADKGFYSQQNATDLQDAKLHFILPLRRNSQLIDYSPTSMADQSRFAGHFAYGERYIWHQATVMDHLTLHLFYDERLKGKEVHDYLARIEKDPEHYTLEKYREKCAEFGTLALLTESQELTSQTVYLYYKSRNEVEVMIDALKNILEADHSYMQDDIALEGWVFINFLALTWYYALYQRVREHELLAKYSPMDILRHLQEIKQVKIGNDWHLSEITEKTLTLLNKVGIPIT
jgi:transposase